MNHNRSTVLERSVIPLPGDLNRFNEIPISPSASAMAQNQVAHELPYELLLKTYSYWFSPREGFLF